MNDSFPILPGGVTPAAAPGQRGAVAGRKSEGAAFAEILDRQTRSVQFSGHARQRMASRGIVLSGEEMTRLDRALASLQAKGGRNSLVMLGEKALVVSVKNQTVVTLLDRESSRSNVFTNIDSAIIA